ncbi:MAG: ABC transporter substrate-binding protein [Lachnospiraceae bacterium]|nr:ABC transporter substrate-binding protein [Lachnospiraceae bacterium]
MSKKIISVILIIAICLTLVACGDVMDGDGMVRETFRWTDDAGRDIEIPTEISRILPSGPSAQIILYSLAPEMLVGLSDPWKDYAKEIIPEEYQNLPYFGQFFGSKEMNIEALVEAEPQLVIDIGEYKKGMEADLDDFTLQTGIPIIFVNAGLADMEQTYEKLGTILGKENEAEVLSAYCSEVYSRTEGIMEQVGENKVRTLYIQGSEGLNALAKGSYQAQLLDLLTDNIAVVESVSEKGLGNEVGLEQIALWNPDFVIFGTGSIYDTVKDIPGWREVTAISNNNYVEAPYNPYSWMGTPPSVQRYLALTWLPAVLYPDDCDYDVKEEILEFYQLFYHCNLTAEQYDKLTERAFIK